MVESKRIAFRFIADADKKYDAPLALLYAKSKREMWGTSLRQNGFEGLFLRYTDSLGTDNWDGVNDWMQLFFRSYCEQKVEEGKSEFFGVNTALNSPDKPDISTLKDHSWTRATEVMCMVTEAVLEATEEKLFTMTTPQLLGSSRAGFDQRYMLDVLGLAYRCFFLGMEGVDRHCKLHFPILVNLSG